MNHPNPTALIQSIIDREFISLRVTPQRSDPYIEGFRTELTKRITGHGQGMVYQPGTAAADAYLAGKEEGRDFRLPEGVAECTALEIHETSSAKV